MWTIFKVVYWICYNSLCFMFYFLAEACGILAFRPGITCIPCIRRCSPWICFSSLFLVQTEEEFILTLLQLACIFTWPVYSSRLKGNTRFSERGWGLIRSNLRRTFNSSAHSAGIQWAVMVCWGQGRQRRTGHQLWGVQSEPGRPTFRKALG